MKRQSHIDSNRISSQIPPGLHSMAHPPPPFHKHPLHSRARHQAHDVQQKPQLVQTIERLMEKQGIEYYEKNVTNQLVEFMHYYVTETLAEAKVYKEYAQKPAIDVADMRLAISSRNYDSFTRPLPISTVKQVADEKNKLPLPSIETLATIMDSMNPRPVGQTQQLPNSLPPSAESVNLVSPNIQVWSDEIVDMVDQERTKTLRMIKMQRKAHLPYNPDEAKPDQVAAKKRPKVRDQSTRKKPKGEHATTDAEKLANDQKKVPLPGEGIPPKEVLERVVKKAENQINIEFDKEAFLKHQEEIANAKKLEEEEAKRKAAKMIEIPRSNPIGKEPEPSSNLFEDSPKQDNNFPLLDQDNQDMNEVSDLFGGDDNKNDLERNYSFGGDLMPSGGLVHMDSNISNTGASMSYTMKPIDTVFQNENDRTPSLSAFINQFPAEPDAEISGIIQQKAPEASDEDENIFGDSDQEDKKLWD